MDAAANKRNNLFLTLFSLGLGLYLPGKNGSGIRDGEQRETPGR
jgi:hypothetical protein